MNTIITSRAGFPGHQSTDLWTSNPDKNQGTISASRLSAERPGLSGKALLTAGALDEIQLGLIPDLTIFCTELFKSLFQRQSAASAIDFIPVFKKLETWCDAETGKLSVNPVRKHVLVENEILKVVLVHWNPGDHSEIHGHPRGGCVFKVLHGSVLEERFSPDEGLRLLGTSTIHQGAMAYIDDNMAFHRVGNPDTTPALTIHAYTAGTGGLQGVN